MALWQKKIKKCPAMFDNFQTDQSVFHLLHQQHNKQAAPLLTLVDSTAAGQELADG